MGANLPGVWWGLGCALAALGDHAPAVDSFRRQLVIQPDNGMAMLNLGKSLFELGQVDPALDAFRRSLGRLPEGADCLALGNIAVAIPGSPAAGNRGDPRGPSDLGGALPSRAPAAPVLERRASHQAERFAWATSRPTSTSGTG